jgi:hypothetical protein
MTTCSDPNPTFKFDASPSDAAPGGSGGGSGAGGAAVDAAGDGAGR